MASSSSQSSRRIPGAPPNFLLEGAGFSYNPDSEPPENSNGDFWSIAPKSKARVNLLPEAVDESTGKGKGKERAREDGGRIISLYGGEELPVFGRPFGFREKKAKDVSSSSGGKHSDTLSKRIPRKHTMNPYEELLAEADDDLDRYAEGKGKLKLTSFGLSTNKTHQNINRLSSSNKPLEDLPSWRDDIVEEETPFPASSNPPTTCVVCTEDFTPRSRPPAWISLACMHKPAVCSTCIAASIKSDLENKMWNKIQCPECGTLLIYDDVRRLADAITFARYEILSFRAALSHDANFVWCRKCTFGQLHASGSSSPIVRCLNCNSLTCFNHQVAWHSRMTCSEYDSFLADPDNFTCSVDRSNSAIELQRLEDEKVARELIHQQRLEEQKRQRAKHREERQREKEAQEVEAKKNKVEWEKEEVKRKIKEEKASLKVVGDTTKRCPGCHWPIEKNQGCAHMTCIVCSFEFCWDCLADYDLIRTKGNEHHEKTCPFHSDNLPT